MQSRKWERRSPNSARLQRLVMAALILVPSVQGQWIQSAKLVGTGALGPAGLGFSVAVSADGQTAVVGGPSDDRSVGAAWVFTRNGDTWNLEAKLVGQDATGPARQGHSVAISADGNTALVGGPGDNNGTGAAWAWRRGGGMWIQSPKLVGGGVVGTGSPLQGFSVALSADGNTALIGGPRNYTGFNVPPGATSGTAWVWTRSVLGIWTQQDQLLASGAFSMVLEGSSVALSADGNTALLGSALRLIGWGWTWQPAGIWKRLGGWWTMQPLSIDAGWQGSIGLPDVDPIPARVAISADGSTALAGVLDYDDLNGGAWVWTPRRGGWTQQGPRLAAAGAVRTLQGAGVAISADGNTAMIGGPGADGGMGAAWLWMRANGFWTEGPMLTGAGAIGAAAQGWSVTLSASAGTAIVGGPADNNGAGAAWVFIIPGADSPGGSRSDRQSN